MAGGGRDGLAPLSVRPRGASIARAHAADRYLVGLIVVTFIVLTGRLHSAVQVGAGIACVLGPKTGAAPAKNKGTDTGRRRSCGCCQVQYSAGRRTVFSGRNRWPSAASVLKRCQSRAKVHQLLGIMNFEDVLRLYRKPRMFAARKAATIKPRFSAEFRAMEPPPC